MTELGLLLAIHFSGLLFAIALARWLKGSDGGGAELHRLGSALGRAADAFIDQELRLVAVAVGVLAPLAFGLYAVLLPGSAGISGLESGFWAAVGLAIGAGSTALVARMGSRLGVAASLRTLAALSRSLDRALGVSVKTGGAIGLLVETVSVIGIALVFGLLYAMKGGFRLDATQAGPLAQNVAMLLPSYAVGVAAAALLLGRGGSTYHASSDVAADLAGERDAGLGHDDPRNPAVVADLVGDHVGATVNRSIDLYLAATLANVTAVIVGAAVHESVRAKGGTGALALAALPSVTRAFGVVASAFGVMVVRTDEPENPVRGLWRGQAATAVISIGGVAGSALWLVGEPHWLRFFWAGVLGVGAASVGAHFAAQRVDRRGASVKELLESLRVGDATGIAFAIGAGLEAVALPLFVIGVATTAAWQLGASTGIPEGGVVATLTLLMTMLASAPYLLALATFAPVADGARGVSELTANLSTDTERRVARLDEAAAAAASVSRAYLLVTGCLSALLASLALLTLGRSGQDAGHVDLAKPAVAWSGALGLAAVLAYAGGAARAGTRGARGVAQEVERQLRGFPRDRGRPVIPEDYTPSYRSSVELAARSALERLLLPTSLALALPVALAVLLRLLYRSSDSGVATEALACFVAMAALTGLAFVLAVDATRARLAAARRASRPGSPAGGFEASVSGDAVADVLGNAAGPQAQLVVKALAVVALAVAPFLRI